MVTNDVWNILAKIWAIAERITSAKPPLEWNVIQFGGITEEGVAAGAGIGDDTGGGKIVEEELDDEEIDTVVVDTEVVDIELVDTEVVGTDVVEDEEVVDIKVEMVVAIVDEIDSKGK